MKILIVAFWFPPANVIGAIRVGKLARYLDRRGHDVRVLTTEIGGDRSQPIEIGRERIVYTDYRERPDWLELLLRPFRNHPQTPLLGGSQPAPAEHGALSKS